MLENPKARNALKSLLLLLALLSAGHGVLEIIERPHPSAQANPVSPAAALFDNEVES